MDESDVLRIKVAASDSGLADAYAKPLVADRGILTGWSECVRGLPLDATEWDLSNLIVEGQAVERSTVVAWLNLIYKMVTAKDFESQEPDAAHTLRGMGQLLAFADAVGSSRGLLLTLESQADAKLLTAEVQLGEHATTQKLTDSSHWFRVTSSSSMLELVKPGFCLGSLAYVGSSSNSIAECRCQISSDMEVVLFHAFKQQLPRLTDISSNFIKQNHTAKGEPLFNDEAVEAIFSDRVLDAVLLHNRRIVIDSILERPDKK